jgi:hypothetical protein
MSLASIIDNEPLDKWGRDYTRGNLGLGKSAPGGSSTSASDTYAALTRAQWNDYLTQIGVPQENKLIKYATDPTVVSDAMTEAGADVNDAFDRQGAANQRRLSGLGLTLSPEEQVVSDRSSKLARSAADVQAQNSARDQTIARQQTIIGNPSPRINALGLGAVK